MKRWVKVKDFFKQVSANVTAGTNADIYTLHVQPNVVLRLTAFGNYVGVAAAWGFLTWNVENNGCSLPPLQNITDQMGLLGQPVDIEPVEFPGGSDLAINLANAAGVPYSGGVILRGEYGYYE